MMLMRLCPQRQIRPRYLVHDTHLFDCVDGRQVISALRLGSEISRELDFQYIVTIMKTMRLKSIVPPDLKSTHVWAAVLKYEGRVVTIQSPFDSCELLR
ncbi:unnamed protein product, partial [Mesorhabditis spiculigera]